MGKGFHRAFVATHTISSCLCVAHKCEFDAEGRMSPCLESAPRHPSAPLHFPFVSLLIFPFYSLPFVLPAPQYCCVLFTYSPIWNNKLKLYSPQLLCSFSVTFSSRSSVFPLVFFFFLFYSWPSRLACEYTKENAECSGKEMTHWKWYCWQVIT